MFKFTSVADLYAFGCLNYVSHGNRNINSIVYSYKGFSDKFTIASINIDTVSN